MFINCMKSFRQMALLPENQGAFWRKSIDFEWVNSDFLVSFFILIHIDPTLSYSNQKYIFAILNFDKIK